MEYSGFRSGSGREKSCPRSKDESEKSLGDKPAMWYIMELAAATRYDAIIPLRTILAINNGLVRLTKKEFRWTIAQYVNKQDLAEKIDQIKTILGNDNVIWKYSSSNGYNTVNVDLKAPITNENDLLPENLNL